MKRRCMGLLLAIAMCAALLPARAEGDAAQAAYDAESGILTVTLAERPAGPVLLIAAGYDDGGRLTDAKVRRLEAGADCEQFFEELAGSYLYRAFLLHAPEEPEPGGGAAYGMPAAPNAVSEKNYRALLAAQGERLFVPTLDDAAGGLTVAEAAGIAVGGVDCVVEMERTGMKIILGDDHKVVMAVEEKMKTYDAVMFVAGVATFDPKTASTGEKLLFLEDLVEKNIDAYENVKVCMDEGTGLIVDRIEGETKQIAVDYTRIEAKDKADLSRAARELLDASDTGILGVDPGLNDGSVQEQKQSFTKRVDSSDAELGRTYAKTGISVPMEETVAAFKEKLDVEVKKVYTRQTAAGGEGGGGGGGGSGGGGSGGGSAGVTLPTPDYSYDDVQIDGPDMSLPPEVRKEATYTYYKDGVRVGEVQYVLDEDMRYWPVSEEWYSGDGDWLVTEYFRKGDTRGFEWHETGYGDIGQKVVTAERWGMVANRYARHEYREGNATVSQNDWYDTARYYPNGQLCELDKRDSGNELAFWQYSPDGALYEYETDWNTDGGFFNSRYTYYVYPAVDPKAAFDPTGHLAESTIHSADDFVSVSYLLTSSINNNEAGDPVSVTWGYTVVTGNSTDAGWDHTGWIPMATVPYAGD